MSDNLEQSFSQGGFSPENASQNVSSSQEEVRVKTETMEMEPVEPTMDEQSYSLGEVPQAYLLDPEICLPLNSDTLSQPEGNLNSMVDEINHHIQEEVALIQKHQKSVDYWEERIEKNKALIQRNFEKARKNNESTSYDKRNRDYWWSRSEQVELDYQNAEVASRADEWSWLIRKYGLKNPDGSPIDAKSPIVEELCNGGCKNLSMRYRASGDKYEELKRERERENVQLARENAKYKSTNETLQKYVSATYEDHIEPLQTGILLLKELAAKLKSYVTQDNNVSYGDLREWAELYLNEFLKDHSGVKQSVVTDFRRIASIPLPPENC
ncbi:MAG: hypothetical protein COT84_07015 [Chlamydiae bacterium CG10_big_fil_rev_8_21_14_0_10_35_9]|nr:MAG: hypothetical protein COT84_07015 [Chlamydiae bacterium CG10_big_fil_rev_8_21_14_0_10_35_9]